MSKQIENIEAEEYAYDADRKRRIAELEEAKQMEAMRNEHNRKTLIDEQRRERVAKYYLQGMGILQICRVLHTRSTTICDDLALIREEWRAARVGYFDRAKTEQLEKLDQIESEASEAWERSKLPAKITTYIEDHDGKASTRIERRASPGDPQFLKVRNDCIARRCKLLGLDAPAKTESNVTATVTHYQPPDSREVIADKIREAVNRLRQPSAN